MKTWFRRLSWPKRLLVTGGGLFGLLVVVVAIAYWRTSVPSPNKIATEQATNITYLSGTTMGTLGKNRTLVGLDSVSKDAQHAVLAAEDRDFYSEPGISLKGIGRAMFSNVKAGGTTQGGSTITQQYAKNAFLTSERTYTRKLKEVFIAVKMSQTVSKDTILSDYLNTIYFGRGAYGIEAASKTYFGVRAKDLTPAQAAVLASSIRSPAGYDPERHPARAKERWDYVLKGMVDKGWLSETDRAKATYPKVLPRKASSTQFPGTLDYIREQVETELAKHGFTEDVIAAGGLTVRTTISGAAESAAIKVVDERVTSKAEGTNPAVAALVAIEPGTGRVVAYYGGSGGGFDYASDGKVQPGSSMKPYVLATALEQGKSLSTRYNGASHQDICGQKDVKNDEGDPPFGNIDLATGLEHSVNTVYFRLACDVGPDKVAELAHKAGIPNNELDGEGNVTAQIALGSGGYQIRPIDQAHGYSTFAANGMEATPYFVESVCKTSDKNECPYKAKVKKQRAFSADVAADTISAMERVVTGGTGTNAQIPGRPTAGKTGTTSNNTNAWFAGFTPQLTTAVWVGRKDGGPLKGVLGSESGVYGGNVPAKIFRAFMTEALQGQPVKDFPPRANVGSAATPSTTTTSTPSATPSATPSPTPSKTLPPVPTPTKVVPTLPPASPTAQPTPSSSPSPPAVQGSPAASP